MARKQRGERGELIADGVRWLGASDLASLAGNDTFGVDSHAADAAGRMVIVMATYPRKPRAAFMGWCLAHGTAFIEHAAEIGISAAEADAFKAETQAANAAILAQAAAQEAAKVATQRAVDAIAKLEKAAGRMVAKVRAFAGTAEDSQAVYAAAQIAPPATPSPQKPPAQPTRLAVTLNASVGELALTWKARNPAGTSGTAYIIRRRLPGENDFKFVGVTGVKRFVDEDLPAGIESVQYIVQGQRANSTGPVSAILTVNFGKPTPRLEDPGLAFARTHARGERVKGNRDPRLESPGHPVELSMAAANAASTNTNAPAVSMPSRSISASPVANMGAIPTRRDAEHPTGSGIPQEVVACNVRIASPSAKRRKR